MSVEPTTADDTDEQVEEDNYDWEVEEDGMVLRKDGYKYVLEYGPFEQVFRDLRDSDHEEGISLRDGSRNTVGTFHPDDEDVPEKIAIAFEVLSHELC